MLPMIRVILFVFGMNAISNVLAALHESVTKTGVEAITISQLVGSWGGGEEVDKSWKLNRHWVGMLNEVVTLGEYKEGGYLESKEKSKAVRFNVLHGGFRCGSSKKDCICLGCEPPRPHMESRDWRVFDETDLGVRGVHL